MTLEEFDFTQTGKATATQMASLAEEGYIERS